MKQEALYTSINEAITRVRAQNPLVPSITNTVTTSFVANAQLAVGGSAAMLHMPDEGETLAILGKAFYINMGTMLPIYEETILRTCRALSEHHTPWVLDPVGIGFGALRTELLFAMRNTRPQIVRSNASEILALARLWGLTAEDSVGHMRGVDATDPVETARHAAIAIAQYTRGAVAVSGAVDLVTDGAHVVRSAGGSHFMPQITGSGCSLGGVIAVYASVTTPFLAALAGTALYNAAGAMAEQRADGIGSFQTYFWDALYQITTHPTQCTFDLSIEEAS